ncbi:NAD-dependent succinate-semialdehyde dehydrogenase [Streptomyces odontomachi]|uniref:NAD-dependent succinate-semialdehyde dehydrogenase n=1 Tax=Streptomyces odontomachi TaxID=2944940 RepID=UPI00210BE718|nr:NAD-dependent succinate-semialdehyde dehydrogenase [Streptomyces sp. ODS25]
MAVTDKLTTYVAGRWQDPERRVDVTNPADASVVGSIGYGGSREALAAVDAAAGAFERWSNTTARYRADLLRAAAELLTERADAIGLLLAKEAGKRLPEAVGEVNFAAEYLRWFAEEARRPEGQIIPNEQSDRRHLTLRRPAGVALSLTPWNFPVSIQARKLAPALAAGCTVVARVSEKAPLAAVELIRCLADAGLPEGVVNLVHGPAGELTEAMLGHRAVRVVSFTGSTGVGRDIMAQASERIVRPLLELGGDAAFLVFDDADLDAAVEGAMIAKFRNSGQSCIGANRFLVQDGIHDAFVERFAARVDAMTVGDGTADPLPDLAPLIDETRVKAVEDMVGEALAAGAHQATRDFHLPSTGCYAAPALLTDVPDHVALARSEVFGPVAGVFRFSAEEEALRRAGDTEMGLAGYAYTRDVDRLFRIGERLEVGIVGFNSALPSVAFAPMGGVKQSGLGREGAQVGLEEFTETRYIALGGVA